MATAVAATATAARFVSRTSTTSSRWLFTYGMSKRISPLFSPRTSRWFSSYPPHEVMGMPSLSPTMVSGTIASWNLSEGDSFNAGDVLCSVETDKATVDFEAQDEGVIAKILVQAGPTEIPCGKPILVTVESQDDVAAFSSFVVEPNTSSPPLSPPAAVAEPTPAAATPPPATTTPAAAAAKTTPVTTGGRVVASPLAHMLAKELGHDITQIVGTGPGGRIIAADVKEFVPLAAAAAAVAETPAAATLVAAAAAPAQMVMTAASPIPRVGYTDYPLTESARELAAALTHSKQNVPHYYLTVDVTMDALLEMRSTINKARGGDDDHQLGTYEFLLKAAAAAMKTVPSANASWMDSVVRVYDSVDINVAVGSGDALYMPVLRNVGGRGCASIAKDLSTFVSAVQDEAPALGDEFRSMGTFTVINLGMYGIKSCAPIIREPQACALALGTMENRIVPSESEEELYKESVVMTATLSCDHRVVDGAVGAQWLSAFKSLVENPATLLL